MIDHDLYFKDNIYICIDSMVTHSEFTEAVFNLVLKIASLCCDFVLRVAEKGFFTYSELNETKSK